MFATRRRHSRKRKAPLRYRNGSSSCLLKSGVGEVGMAGIPLCFRAGFRTGFLGAACFGAGAFACWLIVITPYGYRFVSDGGRNFNLSRGLAIHGPVNAGLTRMCLKRSRGFGTGLLGLSARAACPRLARCAGKRFAFPQLRAPNGVRSPEGLTKKASTGVETLDVTSGGDEGDPRAAAPPAPASARARASRAALENASRLLSSAPRTGFDPLRG